METLSIAALLTASLLGSPHCAGMCGGFVAFYSSKTDRPLLSHLAYNVGRLCTSLILGLAAAYVGRSLNKAASFVGIQQAAALLMGAMLIIWGVSGLFGGLGHTRFGAWFGGKTAKLSAFVIQRQGLSWPAKSFMIGLCSTLLPCGWLYSFVVIAAATADPIKSVGVMFLFWAGTLPLMATLGGITRTLTSPLRRYIPRVTSVLLIAAGLFAVSGHYKLLPPFGAKAQSCDCHEK